MSTFMRLLAVISLSVVALMVTVHFCLAAPAKTGSPIVIATTSGDSKDPDIAVSGNLTHVVWSEAGWIMYSYSSGLTWTVPISVARGDDPSVTVDGSGHPQLAFTEFVSPTINVYHTRYLTGAWTPPLKISGGVNQAALPDIAAAPNGTLSLVWSEQPIGAPQIVLAQSANGGATWPTMGPVLNITGNAPKIAYGSDNVLHLIWQDNSSAPYRIKHSQQLTSTWSLPVLASDNSASSFAPDLTTVLTQAHVVWQQTSSIRYASGANLSWNAPITISTGSASEPAIAALSNGSLLAAWDAGASIQARQGGPAGWGLFETLGANLNGAGHVALSAGSNDLINAVFAWGASGSRDIAYNIFAPTLLDKKVYLPAVLKQPPAT